MKLWKIENKVDGLVYYYIEYIHYQEARGECSDFMKRALASYIITKTNSLIKCRESLENFFDNFCD
jgi:hypothetical protein